MGCGPGLAVDNTAEATAAGALYLLLDAAGKFAVLAKTCRNACIGFVVLGYAIYWAKRGQAAVIGNKGAFLWKKFPKFVLGFLFISLVATIGTLDPKAFPHLAALIPYGFTRPQIAALGNLSRWAFLLTFAGVGLRTSFRDLPEAGG